MNGFSYGPIPHVDERARPWRKAPIESETMDARHPNEVRKTIVRVLRAALGWTQDRLADQVGVHRSTLAKWECGTARVTKSNQEKLARIADREIKKREEKP